MDIYQCCCHDLALVKNGAIDKTQVQYVLLLDHNDQLAAAKAEIADLHRCLGYAHEWLGIDLDYKGSPLCSNISDELAKHKCE